MSLLLVRREMAEPSEVAKEIEARMPGFVQAINRGRCVTETPAIVGLDAFQYFAEGRVEIQGLQAEVFFQR